MDSRAGVSTFFEPGEDDTGEPEALTYDPFFCPDGQDPFSMVEWQVVDAVLKDAKTKEVIFQQDDVEAPTQWSDRAIRIAAQKYFRGRLGTDEREGSIRQLITRVVDTIEQWSLKQGYFNTEEEARWHRNDLAYLLLTQHGAFNSPVWFNLGVANEPQQCSACFIQSVEDDMRSIAQLQLDETMVFKLGSGSGSNLSQLRSSKEHLRGGGTASGPVSFMKAFDSWAGVIKSGGKTRRAAKMVILNVDHPDIIDFIDSKAIEEYKARLLIEAGLSDDFDDPNGAYATIGFQNANHSIRVDDDFMHKVEYALAHPDEEVMWDLKAVCNDRIIHRVPVLMLWKKICDAAWSCGDPGIQFDTTINKWHTCPTDGHINASNPCSEFMFLDDTACNLASLNILKFRQADGTFDIERFVRAVQTFIIAQEVLVSMAHYPTERITENSKRYRPLGLGYANLGAFLMSIGMPYDSDEGRRMAAEITSLMSAVAYRTSAEIAAVKGPFETYERNRAAMLGVIERHIQAAQEEDLESEGYWRQAHAKGDAHGFRNAQVTLLAPTGTIGFLMDCETTGVEPDSSLYKVKQLVGGGTIVMENRIVDTALESLGYSDDERAFLMKYLADNKTLEGCSRLRMKDLSVFDCAIPVAGKRSLSIDAHIKMTAAVQPFLSGAISKTMNMPSSTTPEEIGAAFMGAWKLGLKSITIYRNGSKQSQPLVTALPQAVLERKKNVRPQPVRRKLKDHQTNVHRIKFRFGSVKGYLVATPYEDTGMPGEIFVEWSKEGSTISGLVDGWAQSISYCLQYGVPLETLVNKFAHTKFEPSGFSPDPDIRHASSIYDALMRKLAAVFLDSRIENGHIAETVMGVLDSTDPEMPLPKPHVDIENPICTECGSLMEHSGATCFKCPVCGTAPGCG